MNRYFGALMRSSGLLFDGERNPASVPPRGMQTATTSQEAVAPMRGGSSAEEPLPPTPPAGDADARAGQAVFASRADIHLSAATGAVADSPAAPPARAAETSATALGQDLIRAAMQWVAADSKHIQDVGQVVTPRRREVPVPGEERSVLTSRRALLEPDVDGRAQPPWDETVTSAAPHVEAAVSDETQAHPIRSARSVAAPLSLPAASSPREDIVEISIGSIQVRVDAPAAQTVARHDATPPASGRRAAPARPQRSALSRRPLRRI